MADHAYVYGTVAESDYDALCWAFYCATLEVVAAMKWPSGGGGCPLMEHGVAGWPLSPLRAL